MSVREYIGARYVPILMGEWDNTKTYEPLSIVQYQGNSFTSRQFVPTQVDISNETYWASTGIYNAQIEAYRQEVNAFDGRITDNAEAIEAEETARTAADSELASDITAEETARTAADNALSSSISTLQADLSSEETARTTADSGLSERITANFNSINAINTRLNTRSIIVIGDSWTDPDESRPDWTAQIASELGATVYRYAHGGAGYTIAGNTIETQVDTAISNFPLVGDVNTVTDVIVYAGLNDWRSKAASDIISTANAMLSAMVTCNNKLKSAFPKARKYFGMNTCGGSLSNSISHLIYGTTVNNYLARQSATLAIPFVEPVFYVPNIYDDSYMFDSSLFHLSTNGAKTVGSYWARIIEGIGETVRSGIYAESYPFTNFSGQVDIAFKNGSVRVEHIFAPDTAYTEGTNYDTQLNIANRYAKWVCMSQAPYDHQPDVSNPWVFPLQNGFGNVMGYVQYTTNGVCRIHTTVGSSGSTGSGWRLFGVANL